MKKCIICKKTFPISNFYKGGSYKGRQYYGSYCKGCILAYNATPSRRKKQRECDAKWRENNRSYKRSKDVIDKRKYRKKHPEMRMGRINYNKEHYEMWKVNRQLLRAVKSRKIKKQPCEVCGDENVHAHHDDYSKPFDVKWLCPLHHKALHTKAGIKN